MKEETLTSEEQHTWEQHSLQETNDCVEGDSGAEENSGREEAGNVLAEEDEENEKASMEQGSAGDQRTKPQGGAHLQAPPDPQKDFMGYMQWLGQMLQIKQETLEAQQSASRLQEFSEAETLQSFFHQSVETVKKVHHDFDQAADFLYEMRAKQLAACASLYPELTDPKVIDAMIGDELKKIVQDCNKKNKNPAEVIYTIAQTIGYTGPQNHEGEAIQSHQGESVQGIKSLQESVWGEENIQERQNSARTLAAYNGLSPNGPISLELLDKMSEAEFTVWIDNPKNKAAFNHLMSGEDL
ncbi:conserved protein of unknown function [Bartonella clarridgeiae 73]|uniref:Phage protein n=1 Tax=Bartonella clarridgeiae (strain CCUG 45776 / CIP 104772 / 73) TaxID=696125 RepID=E6YJ11_BARC7|nr:hypothetical protein [Bartonella clarridgeiae]WCR55923.1 MAG: Phage protein [Bartonella clarridgeiae]CBI76849.1 conserved protein of unknown function [Bartonella clarridgeiae 73]